MAAYIGVVHKDEDSDYGVSFPDFPGCVTAGSNLDQARAMAVEALAFHIEGMVEDGQAVPEPSTLDRVLADPDFADGLAYLVVDAGVPSARTVRLNITLPETLRDRVDREARKRRQSRSAFLAWAASDKLRELEKPYI